MRRLRGKIRGIVEQLRKELEEYSWVPSAEDKETKREFEELLAVLG